MPRSIPCPKKQHIMDPEQWEARIPSEMKRDGTARTEHNENFWDQHNKRMWVEQAARAERLLQSTASATISTSVVCTQSKARAKPKPDIPCWCTKCGKPFKQRRYLVVHTKLCKNYNLPAVIAQKSKNCKVQSIRLKKRRTEDKGFQEKERMRSQKNRRMQGVQPRGSAL